MSAIARMRKIAEELSDQLWVVTGYDVNVRQCYEALSRCPTFIITLNLKQPQIHINQARV